MTLAEHIAAHRPLLLLWGDKAWACLKCSGTDVTEDSYIVYPSFEEFAAHVARTWEEHANENS